MEEGLDCRVIPYNSALPSRGGDDLNVDIVGNSSSSSQLDASSASYLLSLS